MQFSNLNACKDIERTYLLSCIHMKEYGTASVHSSIKVKNNHDTKNSIYILQLQQS